MKSAAKHSPSRLAQWLVIALGALPVFLLAFWVPAFAEGDAAIALERFLDDHLLGRVGPWSSEFPLMSKAVANYIAIAALPGALGLIVVWRRHLRPIEQMPALALHRWLLFLAGWLALTALVIHQHYFSYTDFALQRSKFRVFGRYPVLYPFYAAAAMWVIELVVMGSYALFVHYPGQWLARRAGGRGGC
ncbi:MULTISPECIES: hypothetical protein [unclassified Pseudomonas]|uniref:hypothetical protein n=1 Tax=unclassified Pseudomonas TaxID=196821 RepID=UPI00244D6A91|nr:MULTISPECIES: hypothetical protein [unclassified Pseudomonas]MDH0300569.1 hypothetical protein [Pseudomonas sp. GD04091]MDH1984280.1 hypothetical protein [Pseudomonas sp. GD03689]